MTVPVCFLIVVLLLLNPASGYTALKSSYSSTYPDTDNNPILSYLFDVPENDTSSVNETVLNTQENIIFPNPILVSNTNGIKSNPAGEDISKEEVAEIEDVNLGNVESQDDLNTAATFIIGPPYNRPYSHYPINYFPSIWLQRPRYHYYNHNYRPRPVPYIRTHSYRG